MTLIRAAPPLLAVTGIVVIEIDSQRFATLLRGATFPEIQLSAEIPLVVEDERTFDGELF